MSEIKTNEGCITCYDYLPKTKSCGTKYVNKYTGEYVCKKDRILACTEAEYVHRLKMSL